MSRKSRDQEREETIQKKEKEAELNKKAREVAEVANRKAQRRIQIGSIVLSITLLGTAISTGWGYLQFQIAQKRLERVEDVLAQANSLKAISTLSQLAGELRQDGKDIESDKALKKAGLSTLITNEELRHTFLLAATSEAYQSLGNNEKALETIKSSKSISINKSSNIEINILNQVKAFDYFQAGQVKDKKYYQDAYNALKESNFDPFNPNIETDVLNEQDVENIYYQLIKSKNIDMNSETNSVAKDFRNHLYSGLKFLLQEDRLQEADQKTLEIMLYIAKLKLKKLQNKKLKERA